MELNNKSYKELCEMCKSLKINYVGKSKLMLIKLLENKNLLIKKRYSFSLRNKKVLEGEFIRDYPYKNGITYLYIKSDSGKKYLVNPNNAVEI